MEALGFREEKRFAVVMYGGVSLAIYMNGVAQELYRLVQSTTEGAKEPGGSAATYLKIAKRLKAKFVIDILSGTSAGGINAIFLAKALATGTSFDELEHVWILTADIDELINDGKRDARSVLSRISVGSGEPASLLNGNRMYAELLDALNKMARKPGEANVDELDLFVTVTDLQGSPVTIQLASEAVRELQYRGVFHFRKTRSSGAGINQLTDRYHSAIALAARATSSFPLAFEPVQPSLADLAPDDWSQLYESVGSDVGVLSDPEFGKRWLADGGYLDNKPFSYAIDSILERSPDSRLDRKLIYVEPSPEGDLGGRALEKAPNALRNVLKAFTLPRFETIQQDLLRVRRRNRIIERTKRILLGAEQDIEKMTRRDQPPNVADWRAMNFRGMLRKHGFAYGGYFRLRVARLTDELTDRLARHLGISAASDDYEAIRAFVRAWRDEHFCYYPEAGSKRRAFADFILQHDFGFHQRRLGFVIGHIDKILAEETAFPEILATRGFRVGMLDDKELRAHLKDLRREFASARQTIRSLQAELASGSLAGLADIVQLVREMTASDRSVMAYLRRTRPEEELIKSAGAFYAAHRKAFTEYFGEVTKRVGKANAEMVRCKVILGIRKTEKAKDRRWGKKVPGKNPERADWLMAFYFRFFSLYDTISYPLLQVPELGEEIDDVEVVRISPANPELLAGSRLAHFGAFFDRTWREHDILRGRLDGAEAIVRSLCACRELRAETETYVQEVRAGIISEWLSKQGPGSNLVNQIMGRSGRVTATDPVTVESFYSHLKEFKLGAALNPELLASSVARMIRVLGRVLGHVAKDEGSNRGEKTAGTLAAVGAILVGFFEVMLPGTWREIFFRRFLTLLMLFGLVMIVGSAFLTTTGLGPLGWLIFGGGLLLEIVRTTLVLFLRTGQARWLMAVPILAAAAIFVTGIVYASHATNDLWLWILGLFKVR